MQWEIGKLNVNATCYQFYEINLINILNAYGNMVSLEDYHSSLLREVV
jgi:hypothetical protein